MRAELLLWFLCEIRISMSFSSKIGRPGLLAMVRNTTLYVSRRTMAFSRSASVGEDGPPSDHDENILTPD